MAITAQNIAELAGVSRGTENLAVGNEGLDFHSPLSDYLRLSAISAIVFNARE